MFSEKTILIFSGLLENIYNQEEILKTAKFIAPEIIYEPVKSIKDITEFFINKNRLYDWINAVLIKIGTANINGIRQFLSELENDRLFYNHETKCIESFENGAKNKPNWGLFSEGDKVYVCMARIKLTDKPAKQEQINTAFYNYIAPKISTYNGRIWNYNNGNMTTGFYIGDKTDSCIEAAIDILLSMVIFNTWYNQSEKRVNVRISCVTDFINYTNITRNIFGPAIGMLNLLEERMEDNTIIIHENLLKQLHPLKQKAFQNNGNIGDEQVFNFYTEIGK